MRIHDISRQESLRSLPQQYWPYLKDKDSGFRPALNIQQLLRLLQRVAIQKADLVDRKGKKRAASPITSGRVIKQAKNINGTSSGILETTESPQNDIACAVEAALKQCSKRQAHYPHLQLPTRSTKPDGTKLIPVYQRIVDIQFNNSADPENDNHADDNAAKNLGWLEEEYAFISMLEVLTSSLTEPRTIDLGHVNLVRYSNNIVATSFSQQDNQSNTWLFVVPSLDEDINHYELDLRHDICKDVLVSCLELQSYGKVAVESQIRFILLPKGACVTGTLPFQLQLDTSVSFEVPAIFEPLPQSLRKKDIALIDEAYRLFISFLYPPNNSLKSSAMWLNIPFFYSILEPARHLDPPAQECMMQPKELLPSLLPFQCRSVAWMLSREGMAITPDGKIVPKSIFPDHSALPPFWEKVVEGNEIWYLNRLSGAILPIPPKHEDAFGGILAEEPGLGKTLETIALILLNPAPHRNPSKSKWDHENKIEVKEIKTTLIITPQALAPQWIDELKLHAPSLKVLVYEGWSKLRVPIPMQDIEIPRRQIQPPKTNGKGEASTGVRVQHSHRMQGHAPTVSESVDTSADGEVLDWCQYVNTFDVVVTTYNVLRQEFDVARAPPNRPRREDVVYSNIGRPPSPLIMCEWRRVVMDEVQMVGSGKAEGMVSLIPRISSFAVSGTPARHEVADLLHVLKFLRVDGVIGSKALWGRLIRRGFAGEFAAFMRHYAIRTTKTSIKDELTIPIQTRYVVGVKLGRIEKHVYDQNLEAALLELGVDARGVAKDTNWHANSALLRASLRRLRGICTHPQVGKLHKAVDKSSKPGALKTMAEVLESMKDLTWRSWMEDRRAKVTSVVKLARLKQHDESARDRYHQSLEILSAAEREALSLIEDIKAMIITHDAKADILYEANRSPGHQGQGQETSVSDKGKETANINTSEAGDIFGLSGTLAGDEQANKRRALQQRLRECLLTLHRVKFIQGDVHHVLGPSHQASEDEAYGEADSIRRNLLKLPANDAKRLMDQLKIDDGAKVITEDALFINVPFLDYHSDRTRDLVDEVNDIVKRVINKQGALLWTWRIRILELLTTPLTEEKEADGQEYQRSQDIQGEIETYLQAYAALLADRREAMVNERTLLAVHDARERKSRKTKAAIKATAASTDDSLHIPNDVEIRPEHEVLHLELNAQRKAILKQLEGRAMKSLLVKFTVVLAKIPNSSETERGYVRGAITALRRLTGDHAALMEKLEADLATIRKVFNHRVVYFKQLQDISDSVVEVTWHSTIQDAIADCIAEEQNLTAKINTNRARRRYLDNLSMDKDANTMQEEDETCILCRCEFIHGFITECAHIFCAVCLNAWLQRRDGKTCPVCRVPIRVDQMQRFAAAEEAPEPSSSVDLKSDEIPVSRRKIDYNTIDTGLFEKIQEMESVGDFGSKIQTLVKHLLFLQIHDPGAKSICFSAWQDSLHILERALVLNGISCLRVDQNKGHKNAAKRFRDDADILVLLLHGEKENAGLNVTCASRVFLLESVVHHGFEIQAIARIDRMGQTRPTEVYCYYAEDTVEKNILDLAARQGLSLYTKESCSSMLNLLPLEKQTGEVEGYTDSRAAKGDFIFKIDDMLAILFPHMFEDVQHLMQPEDVEMGVPEENVIDTYGHESMDEWKGQSNNAIAGPSRIR